MAVARRVQLVRPLFVLQWCTILLKEFITGDLERKLEGTEGVDCRAERLAQADAMLDEISPVTRPFDDRDPDLNRLDA